MKKSLSTPLSSIALSAIWIYQNGIEIGDDHVTDFENVENETATDEIETAFDVIETMNDVTDEIESEIDIYLDETAILIDGIEIGIGYDCVIGNGIGQIHSCHPGKCEAPFCDPNNEENLS